MNYHRHERRDEVWTVVFGWGCVIVRCVASEASFVNVLDATSSESEPGGYFPWYDLCVEAYKQYGLKTKVIPVSTAEYGLSIAVRPFNSRLDKSKLVESGFKPLPVWQDAVIRYLKEANL